MIEKISHWDIENVFYLIGFIIFLFLFFTSTILPKLRDDAKADLEKENGNLCNKHNDSQTLLSEYIVLHVD
jgi:hypothetical protein